MTVLFSANNMPMNRLLLLGAINGVLAVVLGFFTIPPDQALWLIKHTGYWVILATTAWFVWLLCGTIRRAGASWIRDRGEWRALAVIPAGWLLLMLHEPAGFKIIMDEIMLLGTSMSMHLDKLVQTPYRGHDIQGAFIIVEGMIDKRPIFFPFLLSLGHDVFGYRPENVFWLNGLLALVLLGLVYVVGRKLAGRAAGVVGVLLLAGLPLLAQNARGGGFELLNLVMIVLTLWLCLRYAETREAPELSALCLAAVLLAQTRYESALFILPVALVVLWGWWRERRPVISWPLVFTPLLLLPVPLLHKIFQIQETSWQMFSKPGTEQPFGLEYIWPNLAHAAGFFFDTTGGQPNSLLLSLTGLLGAGFFMLHLVRKLPRWRSLEPLAAATVLFSLGLVALFVLLMGYFWGKFDDPVITRLSLPVHLLFLIFAWLVVPMFPRTRAVWVGLGLVAVGQIWAFSIPAMASHAYTLNYVHGREIEWRREFIRAHPSRDYLVIDPNSIAWITHKVSSTPPLQARLRKEAILFHQRNRSFSEIYVFQRFDVNVETGGLQLVADFDPGPDYTLEAVVERRLHPFSLSRISRVVTIQEGPTASPSTPPEGDVSTLSPQEREKAKQAYWQRWLINLP
jgi:4-amino-4-deoxy-L-arabinose transferase-like glycosyltransferase